MPLFTCCTDVHDSRIVPVNSKNCHMEFVSVEFSKM
jgi:hypothetical protein